jgi:methylase of polypeptide subunit release factors
MDLTREESEAVGRLGAVLLESGMPDLLDTYDTGVDRRFAPAFDLASAGEPLGTLARVFAAGESVERERVESLLSPKTVAALESLGVVRASEGLLSCGALRLVRHLDLLLFCQRASAEATLYYGNDSVALSRVLAPARGRVLDLCSGVGTQALVSARTAEAVTAVEIEPLAEPVFRVNAALNGLVGKVEYLVGDLLEPVAGRVFDLVSCNPPFMPTPPDVVFPRWAGGGPDGLSVVLRLLGALPTLLAPEGRCHLVGAVLGTEEGPDVSAFEEAAGRARLGLEISCRTREAIDEPMLRDFAATSLSPASPDEAVEAFRRHFASLGATYFFCYLLEASVAQRPSLAVEHEGSRRVVTWR